MSYSMKEKQNSLQESDYFIQKKWPKKHIREISFVCMENVEPTNITLCETKEFFSKTKENRKSRLWVSHNFFTPIEKKFRFIYPNEWWSFLILRASGKSQNALFLIGLLLENKYVLRFIPFFGHSAENFFKKTPISQGLFVVFSWKLRMIMGYFLIEIIVEKFSANMGFSDKIVWNSLVFGMKGTLLRPYRAFSTLLIFWYRPGYPNVLLRSPVMSRNYPPQRNSPKTSFFGRKWWNFLKNTTLHVLDNLELLSTLVVLKFQPLT